MYNSIYPININYRKNSPYRTNNDTNSSAKNQQNSQTQTPQQTVQSNQINISQILTDFRNTILAINAPQEVQDEVNVYLELVEKEASKTTPSRDIILSNLKNASKISDNYITSALGKKSNVVEGWISTIFLQNINLKANPDEINPDFLLQFPQNAQNRINSQIISKPKPLDDEVQETNEAQETPQVVPIETQQVESVESSDIEVESSIELSNPKAEGINIFENREQPEIKKSPFSALTDTDKLARSLFTRAKNEPKTDEGNTEALNLLNEALGYLQNSQDTNKNIKAAIHFERGKIFDNYDYVDYALRDYYEATKASDYNLKANAFYKSGSIYDEFREYKPALDNYLSSVAYSGEAENTSAQSHVLSKIASLYAKQFDIENSRSYDTLAIDTALDTNNSKTIAKAYSQSAQNFQYLGENKDALESYKNALFQFSQTNESYEQMAYNYEQASVVMRKLGNSAKADKLQQKAQRYYQIALKQQEQLEAVS